MSDQFDAQRILERKALANVRGLLDKLEAEERERFRGTWKTLGVVLVASLVVACVAIGVTHWWRSPNHLAPADAHATGAVIVERVLEARKRLGVPNELAGKSGAVDLEAIIRPDGSLKRLTVVTTSGDPTLDTYAVKVVESASPFGTLPASVIAKNEAFRYTLRMQFSREREP